MKPFKGFLIFICTCFTSICFAGGGGRGDYEKAELVTCHSEKGKITFYAEIYTGEEAPGRLMGYGFEIKYNGISYHDFDGGDFRGQRYETNKSRSSIKSVNVDTGYSRVGRTPGNYSDYGGAGGIQVKINIPNARGGEGQVSVKNEKLKIDIDMTVVCED